MAETPPAARARLGALTGARIVLLAGPAALAFWSGGYFDQPRVVAGFVAWLLVAVALLSGKPLPRAPSVRLALIGLALFAAWTLVSFLWAPIAGSAYHAGQRVVLYAGALLAAALLLRSRVALQAVTPALAAGALVVIGYGTSERLLPGLLHFSRSASALGRLEQPLTYWNAMGELAAIGLVLCAAVAGESRRGRALRAAAAAAAAPLGMGLYLTFSRGALFAFAAGLLTLFVCQPNREQVRAGAVAIGGAVLAALASAPFHSVTSLAGPISTRERQGAIVLALLVVITLATAGAMWRLSATAAPGVLRLPRAAPWIAFALICAGLVVALLAGAKERSSQPLSAGATRYATLQSNRYSYWRVAIKAFVHEPVRGVGAGGWAVWWLRHRPFNEFSQDAHSLPLQTAAELGVIGLALLAAFLAGIGWAGAAALRIAPPLAAGPLAGFVAWAAHQPLDWDWQMPAVTLFALALAGALLALADLGYLPTAPRRTMARP